MADEELISVVIPAYNAGEHVLETLESVERQTHACWEAIVVDDGSDRPESREILAGIEARADDRIRVVHQENRGLAGARNAGFRHARGEFVIPLDADDQLEPRMMAVCLRELRERPDAGFAYFDYRVFGDLSYVEAPGEFNFYRLLSENFMSHCCCLRRSAWEASGGYDEWHRWGYEDWSFYLNLAKNGFFGLYIPETLFRYRTHGRGLHFTGLERHDSNWARMEEAHPTVLSREGRLRIKREWAPSICVVAGGAAPDLSNQTLLDYQLLVHVGEAEALERSSADAFFWIAGGGRLRPQALEEALLGLQDADWVTWRDTGDAPPPSLGQTAGPLGVSRAALKRPEPNRSGEVRRIPWRCRLDGGSPVPAALPAEALRTPRTFAGPAGGGSVAARIHRHLHNAEILSIEAWTRHPLRSAARLIPLRLKERINEVAGGEVFDLSFYLKFQPRSVAVRGKLVAPVDYIAVGPRNGKKRVGLLTPHLGYGGAETVLLELGRQIDRSQAEVVLIAAHSNDGRMTPEWEQAVDWVFDVGNLAPVESAPRVMLSLALAWELDVLVVQNSAAVYSILPAWKQRRPGGKAIDVLHIVDEDWDLFSATLEVSDSIDTRVVISEQGRRRLEEMGVEESRIRLIANGVDLELFNPARYDRAALRKRLNVSAGEGLVVFLARLVEMKRPLLLPEIAREVRRLDGGKNVVFAVAGSGPLETELRARIRSLDLESSFRMLGHVREPAGLLAAADVLVMPSESEGVPLTMLEAMAMGTPVVASRAGAIEESLRPELGVLVEPGPDEERRLAEALVELLNDDARRAEMGRAGRAEAERSHSLERSRAEYRKLMEETLVGVERRGGLGVATPAPPRGEIERGSALGLEQDR